MAAGAKVGIIACSGEEIPAGTVSRLAARRVLELLRPQSTVTLCLPLFLAGEEQERRFAQEHPTITVDGCDKLCARRGTEKYSGPAAASLVVTEILGDRVAACHRSARDFDKADEAAVWIVAERIAAEVDALAATPRDSVAASPSSAACCSCSQPTPEAVLHIDGAGVTVNGLPLVFDHLYKSGLRSGDGFEDRVLKTVRIYHVIEPAKEAAYRHALAAAYREYCQHKES